MKRTGLPRLDRPLSGPEHYWKQMRALTEKSGGFSISEIYGASNGVCRSTVQNYILGCITTGAVEEVAGNASSSSRKAKRYCVKVNTKLAPTEHGGFNESATTRAHEQLWTAMRTLPFFTVRQLAISASTDEVQIHRSVARAYAKLLMDAGYLLVAQPQRGRTPASLRLKPSMNTGPKAPVRRSDSAVVDRNRREVVRSVGTEAQA